MIHIYKEDNKKYVTRGAYESFYKPLGYKISIDAKPQEVKTVDTSKLHIEDEFREIKRVRGSSTKKNMSEENNDAIQDIE